jgi:hypothetical protein
MIPQWWHYSGNTFTSDNKMGWVLFGGLIRCTPRINYIILDPNHYNLYAKQTQRNDLGTINCRLFRFSGDELTSNPEVNCDAVCLAWV